VLLVDHCPGCGKVPRSTRVRMLQIPEPGRCSAPTREPGRNVGAGADCCEFDLTASHAQAADVVDGCLNAQAFVNNLLDHGNPAAPIRVADGTTISPMEVFADLKAVASGVLTVLTDEDLEQSPYLIDERFDSAGSTSKRKRKYKPRPGFMAPRTAARMAFATSKAVEVVAAPNLDTAADRMGWIIDRMRRSGRPITPTSVTRSWGICSQALQAVMLRALDTTLRPSDRLRYRTATPHPATQGPVVPPMASTPERLSCRSSCGQRGRYA
jgi:hypothetical protein